MWQCQGYPVTPVYKSTQVSSEMRGTVCSANFSVFVLCDIMKTRPLSDGGIFRNVPHQHAPMLKHQTARIHYDAVNVGTFISVVQRVKTFVTMSWDCIPSFVETHHQPRLLAVVVKLNSISVGTLQMVTQKRLLSATLVAFHRMLCLTAPVSSAVANAKRCTIVADLVRNGIGASEAINGFASSTVLW